MCMQDVSDMRPLASLLTRLQRLVMVTCACLDADTLVASVPDADSAAPCSLEVLDIRHCPLRATHVLQLLPKLNSLQVRKRALFGSISSKKGSALEKDV